MIIKEYIVLAYKEALKAYKKGEIPVGSVIIKDDKIISKAHNDRQKKHNILGHAEIEAIIKAEKKLKDWRLNGCTMFVTLQPCDLCEQIILEARLDNVYYLIKNNNKIKEKELKNIVQTNVCQDINLEYKKLVNNFFKKMRK